MSVPGRSERHHGPGEGRDLPAPFPTSQRALVAASLLSVHHPDVYAARTPGAPLAEAVWRSYYPQRKDQS